MRKDLDNNTGRQLHHRLRRRTATMYTTRPRTSSPTSTYAVVVFLCLSCCVHGAQSFVITPKEWDFLQKHNVGYEVAKPIVTTAAVTKNNNTDTALSAAAATTATDGVSIDSPAAAASTPILLLNGFGVGSFHQHRLIERLFTTPPSSTSSPTTPSSISPQHKSTVYCMDYLGQGRSWPKLCQDGQSINEQGLQYSAELWVQQIITFIEDIIQPSELEQADYSGSDEQRVSTTKVHIVGNSVGGHLAAYVAARRPDLVESIVLLNPTPVWGLNLPGWTGHLPPPAIPKFIGRFLFDRIRALETIESFLKETYSRREAFTDELMHQIRGCTLGDGGHAAFASIMWSPPLQVQRDDSNKDSNNSNKRKRGDGGNFQDCLVKVSCDVLLVFGKDDPWCKPAFAKKMMNALDQREPSKVHRYVEISNTGHCPNHEAPTAVSHLLRSWTGAVDDRRSRSLMLFDETPKIFEEDWGQHSVQECNANEIQVGFMDRLATTFVS